MVDSADRPDRLEDCRNELMALLKEEVLITFCHGSYDSLQFHTQLMIRIDGHVRGWLEHRC